MAESYTIGPFLVAFSNPITVFDQRTGNSFELPSSDQDFIRNGEGSDVVTYLYSVSPMKRAINESQRSNKRHRV